MTLYCSFTLQHGQYRTVFRDLGSNRRASMNTHRGDAMMKAREA